jgi:hypothetical protein
MPKKKFIDGEPEPPKRPSKLVGTAKRVYERWDEAGRPGLVYILSTAVTFGGIGVAVVDNVFETGIGDRLANTQIEADDSWLERSRDSVAQCIGILAGGEASNECRMFQVIFSREETP